MQYGLPAKLRNSGEPKKTKAVRAKMKFFSVFFMAMVVISSLATGQTTEMVKAEINGGDPTVTDNQFNINWGGTYDMCRIEFELLDSVGNVVGTSKEYHIAKPTENPISEPKVEYLDSDGNKVNPTTGHKVRIKHRFYRKSSGGASNGLSENVVHVAAPPL